MHEIETRVLVPLPKILGIDLSITNEVILLWFAASVTFILLAVVCRRREEIAKGVYRNLFEALIEFVEKEIVREGIGREGLVWAPFLLTLFFFILFCNLLGMIPLPSHFKSITSNISVTVGLASIVFAVTILVNIRYHGLFGFLRKFRPSGVSRWIAVMVVPIEIVTWLVRPFSLAIRLFANMMAGHYLIFIFIGLEMAAVWYLKALPLVGAVAMGVFELFVCFIQAFIFTMLAGMYIREAVQETH